MKKEMINMTWPEYEKIGDCIVAICVGSVEQHGPHLPFITDLLIPYDMCLDVSEKRNVLVAPPIYYGCRSKPASGGGIHFPGTTFISASTLMKMMEEVMEDFYRQGKKKFLIMSGHYENTPFMDEAAYNFTAKYPDAKVVLINWFEMICQESLDKLFDGKFPGWEVEHASLTETALMLHYRPELTNCERVEPQEGKPFHAVPVVYPEPTGQVPPSGILYCTDGANAEMGKAMAEEIVQAIIDTLDKEFAE